MHNKLQKNQTHKTTRLRFIISPTIIRIALTPGGMAKAGQNGKLYRQQNHGSKAMNNQKFLYGDTLMKQILNGPQKRLILLQITELIVLFMIGTGIQIQASIFRRDLKEDFCRHLTVDG